VAKDASRRGGRNCATTPQLAAGANRARASPDGAVLSPGRPGASPSPAGQQQRPTRNHRRQGSPSVTPRAAKLRCQKCVLPMPPHIRPKRPAHHTQARIRRTRGQSNGSCLTVYLGNTSDQHHRRAPPRRSGCRRPRPRGDLKGSCFVDCSYAIYCGFSKGGSVHAAHAAIRTGGGDLACAQPRELSGGYLREARAAFLKCLEKPAVAHAAPAEAAVVHSVQTFPEGQLREPNRQHHVFFGFSASVNYLPISDRSITGQPCAGGYHYAAQ